jgi:hypothetical protein
MRLSPFISVPWLRHAAVTVMSRVSQSPWRLLQQLGLLRFGAAPAPERQGALLRQLGSVLAGDVGGGRWVATGNPRASFRGTQDSCPLLAEYGRTLGLSATGSWLAVAVSLCWSTFGLLIGDPAQTVTNAVVGAGNTAVLGALLVAQPHLRSRRMLMRTATGAAGLASLAAVSIASVAVLGADPAAVAATLGVVVSLAGAAAALPQLLSLLLGRPLHHGGRRAAQLALMQREIDQRASKDERLWLMPMVPATVC